MSREDLYRLCRYIYYHKRTPLIGCEPHDELLTTLGLVEKEWCDAGQYSCWLYSATQKCRHMIHEGEFGRLTGDDLKEIFGAVKSYDEDRGVYQYGL